MMSMPSVWRTGVPVFLCAAIVVVAESSVSAQRTADEYGVRDPLSLWHQARKMQRDYVERLRKQSEADPSNLALKLDLGRAYHGLALEHDEAAQIAAERVFGELLAANPNDALALVYHGSLLGLRIGRNLVSTDRIGAAALASFAEMDRAVALEPDSIEIRYIRGYSSYYTPSFAGRDPIAIEDFGRIATLLEQMPGTERHRAEVHIILGDSLRKTGDLANARSNWEITALLAPNSELSLVAEDRLRIQAEHLAASSLNAAQIASLFGFLTGTAIFSFLSVLVLRDLMGAARRRKRSRGNMLAALAVSLGAFIWNGYNFIAAVTVAFGLQSGWLAAAVARRHHSGMYLLFALSPIPFGLVVAYRFYKATFMDIVLKRGAALLTIVVLSVVYAQLVEIPLRMAILQVPSPALRSISFAGMWLWIYALYPPIRDRIYRLVDRYLFQRRDYSGLLDGFNERLSIVTDEESLLATVSNGLKEAFAADPVKVIDGKQDLARRLARSAGDRGTSVLQRRDLEDESLEIQLEERDAELALVLAADADLEGVILIGPRSYGQGYLSEELSVLRAVAIQIGRSIENLRLHQARRKQAIAEEELRKLVVQAQLQALRAQIDPHFFFNSLNSVAALIHDDPKAAEELIEDLSDLFRHAFRPGREMTALGEELGLVETYLKVERIRLGDRLGFVAALSPGAASVPIPALCIQPLIENAVKHGVAQSSNGGTITLSAAVEGGFLHVSVSDTGVGIPSAEMSRIRSSGVGLSNVNHRLVGLYGEGSGLRIESAAGRGTTVAFTIPIAENSVESALSAEQVLRS